MKSHHRWATVLFIAALFGVAAAPVGAVNYTITDLGTLPGYVNSSATGVNNNGQMVGVAYTAGDTAYHAFLYSNNAMTDLGTLGGENSLAFGINNNGQVVGYADLTCCENPASPATSRATISIRVGVLRPKLN